ncbi:leucine-rich repeat domain-containing protein [Treponema endosymbiont of Eucomonympha sp.]|uniref:leucine-rich repeat domain-containing protein n=1 Tax=Treponema endosymbiont of Eucomonympha sp. TaxID=1580831 RepID=UPI00078465C3|nr:leucine-rich repeat domain-containing protein [Treponema endosymbiont of Eucomonympha sp.]
MNRIMLRAAAVGTAMMLTAAGCKQSNDTIYVPVDKEKPVPVFTGVEALKAYLEEQSGGGSAAEPVPLKLSVALSADETAGLFAALAAAGKYVSLDLSECKELDVWEHYGTGADRVVSLVLPDSVTEIAKGTSSAATFASFASLETLTANGVKTVGNYAFRNSAALASISLPAATVIEGTAFQDCAALASANLYSATDIKTGAFTGCANLTDIRVSSDNPNYSAKDGMLLDKAGTTLAAYPSAHGEITTLPETITAIGDYAFRLCAALTSVNLPAAVTIGAYTFQDCAALESANLSVATAIGAGAFQNCAALASISLPSAATIGANAFNACVGKPACGCNYRGRRVSGLRRACIGEPARGYSYRSR